MLFISLCRHEKNKQRRYLASIITEVNKQCQDTLVIHGCIINAGCIFLRNFRSLDYNYIIAKR